jgi:hypothetical protein
MTDVESQTIGPIENYELEAIPEEKSMRPKRVVRDK